MIAGLLQSLNHEFDISATDLRPFGPIWKVKSVKGFFALKRTGGPGEKLERLYQILSQINQAGFDSLILPEISRKGLPFFEINGDYYQLFLWRQGSHPSFTEPDMIKKSVYLFAGLHRISSEMLVFEDSKILDLATNFEQKVNFIEKTKKFLETMHPLNHVDRALLSWSYYFLNQARFALAGLAKIKPALKPKTGFGFCHNDPAPRNIIVDDGQCFLIDFELSDSGWFVIELTKLIGRVLQVNDWRQQVFDSVIDAYSQVRAINDWEKTILPYLLCFPQHFWRICSQRFEEKLNWSERRFGAKIWKIIATEKQRQFFLNTILPELPILERSKVAIS